MASAYGLDPDPGMHEDFDFRSWSERAPISVGPFTITPFRVLHPIEEAYALRVEVAEPDEHGVPRSHVLTYSGDTDTCAGLVDAAQDADVFLCEAAFHEGRDDAISGVHLTGKRAGAVAREASAKRLLLTHLPVWNDANVAIGEARQSYDGSLAVAVAGVSYTV
jgi:ribonuclease BN (tRNA processing enzyme)